MKKINYLILFLISSIGISQNKFEKGYYIDNAGTNIACLIKNYDWKHNPTSIEIKKTEEANSQEIMLSQMQEFSINGISKYTRQTIEVDNSKGEPYYSNTKEPHFVTSTVLLKVLVSGKNTLYGYENDEYPIRFFYKTEQSEIKQLIYKKYFSGNQNDLYVNSEYKKQLFSFVKSENLNKIEELPYKENELIKYFGDANKFQGDVTFKEIQKIKKTSIYFKLLLNTNYSHFDFQLASSIPFDGSNKTERKITMGYGVEVEVVLPYNNKNWSIFLAPSYNSYSGTGTFRTTYYINPNYSTGLVNTDFKASVTYNYLQVPFGVRRNINFKKHSRMNIQIGGNLEFSTGSKFTLLRSNNNKYIDVSINNRKINYLIGVGYENKKFGVELRQYSNINVNPLINTNNSYFYRNISLSLSYRLNK